MLPEVLGDPTLTAFLVAFVATLLGAVLFQNRWRKNYPPGPTGLPLVGYIPFLTMKPYLKLQELKKRYGPIFSLQLGSKPAVVLCDFPSIKEAFNRDALMGRPPDSVFDLNKETNDTEAVNGLPWKEQRRLSLHILRDLGFGKSRMETHIREEITELMEILEKQGGNHVMTSKLLAPSMSNNISSVVFGKRRRFDDPKRLMLDGILRTVSTLIGKVAWLTFFPLLKQVINFLHIGKQNELSRAFRQMSDYVKEEIKEHKETFDPNNIRDFIDGYLVEIDKRKHDPNTTFTEKVMEDLVKMFFGAGSETVRLAVDWLLLISAGLPHIQEKVQNEIDSVIGKERFPSREDHLRMPYTEAVIMETLRWRSSFPINFPRYTLEEVKLSSFTIPKETYMIAVFWAVHHDPLLWGEDVEEFNPQRFLSPDGNEVLKPEYFIPFSIGKRSCPGESLAYTEVFMYFTAMLQKFNLRLPDGEKPDFEGQLSLGLQPKPYKLCLEVRS